MHLGEVPWTSQVWRKKQDNWPKVNKDPGGLSYAGDLCHLHNMLLLTQDTCTPLSVFLCLVSDVLWSSSSTTPALLSGCVFMPGFWPTALLLIRENAYTLPLWVCISALLLSWKNCFLVYAPKSCAVSLIINFVLAFTFFTSLKHSCFQTRARAKTTLLLAFSSWWPSG